MASEIDFEDQTPNRVPDELLVEFLRNAGGAVRPVGGTW